MPLRFYVMGGHKNTAHFFRYGLNTGNRPFAGNSLHKLFAVKAPLTGNCLKEGIDLKELAVVHNISDIHQGKDRLNTA